MGDSPDGLVQGVSRDEHRLENEDPMGKEGFCENMRMFIITNKAIKVYVYNQLHAYNENLLKGHTYMDICIGV